MSGSDCRRTGPNADVSPAWIDEEGLPATLVVRTERVEKSGVVVLRKRAFAVEEGQV
jgi:hypothetical protein